MKLLRNIIIAVIVLMTTFSNGKVFAESHSSTIFSSRSRHEIKILTHGLASLKERLMMIESAKKSVDAEYFIFNADESGKLIIDAMIKKSKVGVRVRLVLDSMFGKRQINTHIIKHLKDQGVEVRYFNDMALVKGFNNKFRNHRKSLIIDGEMALVGGRNVGNEYFDMGKKFSFFDRDLVVNGEIVTDIELSFNELWDSEWTLAPAGPVKPAATIGRNEPNPAYVSYKKLERAADNFLNMTVGLNYLRALETVGEKERIKSVITSCENISFITERPVADDSVEQERVINNYLINKIQNAQKSVVIESPYFTLNNQTEVILDDALNRDVDVSILSNGANSTDVKIAAAAIDKVLRKWFQKGVNFYLYNGEKLADYELSDIFPEDATTALHAKTFIFDDKDILIGTHNFDFISAKYNDESLIECSGAPEAFLAKVKEDIKKRIDQSIAIRNERDVDELGDSILYNAMKGISGLFYDDMVN
ncbi:MAG: phosphatidylserine/phosphatidylglycerophosphate/cardiolipin synthase family protein [Bacteriovorax sp.]|jgi:putative cardiolipin synthase